MSAMQSPAEADVTAFCDEVYGLSGVEFLGELSGGMFARPVLVGSKQGRFVLRNHQFRGTPARFQFQAEAMDGASRFADLCQSVVRTLEGDWCVVSAGGDGVVALHRFAEGESMSWPDWRGRLDGAPCFAESIGERVAELHNRLAELTPAGEAELDIDLPPIQFLRIEASYDAWLRAIDGLVEVGPIECERSRVLLVAIRGRLDEYWGRLIDSAKALRAEDVPSHVVHGDVSPVNLVWNVRGVATFIDWDATHIGHRLYDALGDVLHRAPEEPAHATRLCLDHLRSYLAGYARSLRTPLSDQELSLVPAYTLARQLEDLRQRVAVLPTLPATKDESYERLIFRRVAVIDQIIDATPSGFYDCLPTR